jgi:hypothetical protein
LATAYATAPNSAEFQAAAAAVDQNSVAVADAVGAIVPDQRESFLDAVSEALGHHAETLAGAIDSFSGALVE